MVSPGGTGSPAFVISAKFAPFPPRRLRIVELPSLKSHTRFSTINFSFVILNPYQGLLPPILYHKTALFSRKIRKFFVNKYQPKNVTIVLNVSKYPFKKV